MNIFQLTDSIKELKALANDLDKDINRASKNSLRLTRDRQEEMRMSIKAMNDKCVDLEDALEVYDFSD